MNEGYYTVVTFKSAGDFPAEMERLMNIDESVLRSMVIRLEYDAAEKAAKAPVEETVAEAVVEESAPAADAEAPSAGDVSGETASSKGSPDTGIEDVAVVAGLAIVAGGAVLVSKKRK